MKEIEYDGPGIKGPSAWEKRYAESKANDARLLRTPSTRDFVPQKPIERSYSSYDEHKEMHLGKIILVLILVLVLGLSIGAYALIGTRSSMLADTAATTTHPLVTSEDTDIMLSDSPRAQILADIAIVFGKTVLPEGGVRKIRFLVKDERGGSRPATVKEFFKAVNKFSGSDALVRSLDSSFVYEVGSDAGLVGKLTLLTRSYPNTFAHMLDWESAMSQDLLPILHPELTQNNIKETEGRIFRDERIGDIDARILRDALGNVLIVYGFIDSKTLVITGGIRIFAPAPPVASTK